MKSRKKARPARPRTPTASTVPRLSSSTAQKPGGPPSSTCKARQPRTIPPSSPDSAGRTVSAFCPPSTGSIPFFTSNTKTSTAPTRAFSKSLGTTASPIFGHKRRRPRRHLPHHRGKTDSLQQSEGMEHFGELDHGKESDGRSVGVWLRRGRKPPARAGGSEPKCTFCRQNFSAGAEVYGGLATVHDFGLNDTSHYAGPTACFNVPHGPALVLLAAVRAQRQQRGRVVARHNLLRDPAVPRPLPPEGGAMKHPPHGRIHLLYSIVLCSRDHGRRRLLAHRVPAAERQRMNPYAGQAGGDRRRQTAI